MRRGVWVFAALAVLVMPVQAQAAFPGNNGKIAFSDTRDDTNPSGCGSSCNYEIYSINPDGTEVSRLTNDPAYDLYPAWSPDGEMIAFISSRAPAGIYTMGANGENVTFVRSGFDPSWSADGTKILFVPDGGECGVGTGGVWKMNPDGTNQEFIACGPSGPGEDGEAGPVWSPDGKYIAFGADLAEFDLFRVDADGANRVTLTDSPNELDSFPNWAPDGSKIAFGRDPFTQADIWTMNPDGTGQAPLITNPSPDENPAYSPDGTKIAFYSSRTPLGIYTASSAGGPETFLTRGIGGDPDWQPDPEGGYPRPKGATPFYGSLTVAYEPCTAPDRTHGPPLAYGSCSSPQMTSDYLTVGTADANGNPPRNEGHLRLDVVPGNPSTGADEADVKLDFFMDDVFTKSLADYTGELRARVALRITDRDTHYGGEIANVSNTTPIRVTTSASHLVLAGARVALLDSAAPCANHDAHASWNVTIDSPTSFTLNGSSACGGGAGGTWYVATSSYPGTVVDIPLEFAAPCTAVADPLEGSSCAVSTTANAVTPGSVKERKRTIWQLGRVEVYDGGADGDAQTPTGDTLFATQGLFIP